LVFLVDVVRREDLGIRAKIVAIVLALHNSDVVFLGYEARRIGLAVHDKDKIGGSVQRVCNEKFEIRACIGGVGVCV
jgi:hypothetical protein